MDKVDILEVLAAEYVVIYLLHQKYYWWWKSVAMETFDSLEEVTDDEYRGGF